MCNMYQKFVEKNNLKLTETLEKYLKTLFEGWLANVHNEFVNKVKEESPNVDWSFIAYGETKLENAKYRILYFELCAISGEFIPDEDENDRDNEHNYPTGIWDEHQVVGKFFLLIDELEKSISIVKILHPGDFVLEINFSKTCKSFYIKTEFVFNSDMKDQITQYRLRDGSTRVKYEGGSWYTYPPTKTLSISDIFNSTDYLY